MILDGSNSKRVSQQTIVIHVANPRFIRVSVLRRLDPNDPIPKENFHGDEF